MPSTIPFSTDDAIESLARRFTDRTLPKAEWTHEAHLAVAVALLARLPAADVARRLPPMIRAYNEATGVANTDTGGYHETITLASIRAVAALMAAHPARPLQATVEAVMASPLGRRDWMLAYWSHGRLFGVDARRAWCEPDLAALPF